MAVRSAERYSQVKQSGDQKMFTSQKGRKIIYNYNFSNANTLRNEGSGA
jgi:hypothetical protein